MLYRPGLKGIVMLMSPLLTNSWEGAKIMASLATKDYIMHQSEPQTFAAKRANVILALRSSRYMVVPPELMRSRTTTQIKSEQEMGWKAYMRLGRAYAGLCRKLMAAPITNEAKSA